MADYSCAVAMLIAQLVFHGMPLRQGMVLTRLLRLHEIQDDEIRRLLKTVMELPIRPLPAKCKALTDPPSQTAGEVVCHIIHSGLFKNFTLEEICHAIRVVGLTFADQAVDVANDMLPRAHVRAELRARLNEAGCGPRDDIRAQAPKYRAVSHPQINHRAWERTVAARRISWGYAVTGERDISSKEVTGDRNVLTVHR